jgi:hypothetical protein
MVFAIRPGLFITLLLVYDLNDIEKDIIRNHMFPLTFLHWPHSKEARIVAKMDHKEARAELYEQKRPAVGEARLSRAMRVLTLSYQMI